MVIQTPNIMGQYAAGVSRRLGELQQSQPQQAMRAESGMPMPDGFAADGDDRDIAIRTMLGEAAGEDDEGMAAVLHVILNRTKDPRWGGTIKDVALAPKQFSAWNRGAGGNDLVAKYGPGTPQYERAAAIYDAVMAGRVNDPTGGATHYYSPAGMDALVDSGAQSNRIPTWLEDESAMGTRRIGGHVFAGQVSPMSRYGGY